MILIYDTNLILSTEYTDVNVLNKINKLKSTKNYKTTTIKFTINEKLFWGTIYEFKE